MGLVFRLILSLLGRVFSWDVASSISIYVMMFVGPYYVEKFQDRLWGTPREQQESVPERTTLSAEAEALFVIAQHYMDVQFEVGALRHQIQKLPALPEEGY